MRKSCKLAEYGMCGNQVGDKTMDLTYELIKTVT